MYHRIGYICTNDTYDCSWFLKKINIMSNRSTLESIILINWIQSNLFTLSYFLGLRDCLLYGLIWTWNDIQLIWLIEWSINRLIEWSISRSIHQSINLSVNQSHRFSRLISHSNKCLCVIVQLFNGGPEHRWVFWPLWRPDGPPGISRTGHVDQTVDGVTAWTVNVSFHRVFLQSCVC